MAAIATVSLVSAFFASRVGFDNSIEVWFLENDPNLVTYRSYLDRFETDEIAVLALFTRDVFSPEALRCIQRMTEEARRAPHAHRVLSLTNAELYRATEDGVELASVLDQIPQSASESDRLRRLVLSQPLLTGNLVSKDGRVAAVVVEMRREGGEIEGKRALVGALETIARNETREGRLVRLTGTPPMDDAFFRYSEQDFALLGPLVFVLVLLVTGVLYRRVAAVVLPLLVTSLASLWTFGLMGLLGIDLTIISSSLVAFVLAVGVADSIHLLSNYFRRLADGEGAESAVESCIAELAAACLFTSLTTAAGLLSLLASDLEPLREFGWLAAFAVLCALALSLSLAPATLIGAGRPDPKLARRVEQGLLARLVSRLARPSPMLRRSVLAISIPLLALSVWGVSLLEIGSNPMNYFRRDSRFRVDTEAIDDALGGSTSVEMLIEAPGGGLRAPQTIARLAEIERWLESKPGVTEVYSVVDELRELYRVLRGVTVPDGLLPESQAMIAQLYLLLEGEEDFDRFVREDYSVARMTARVKLSQSGRLAAEVPAIERWIEEKLSGQPLRVSLTGYVKLMGDMEHYLLDSQIRSILLAFVVITAMMFLLLRSLSLALFSMVPNLLPIVAGLGFMAATGISLDPGTVMIGCIALGLVVDDTVHFLLNFKRAYAGGQRPVDEAVAQTMKETGRPIVVTSLVLASSFLLFVFGNFNPNVDFGLISALVILLALAADLLMLPALLFLLLRPKSPRRPA